MISATRLVEVERLIATQIVEDALKLGLFVTVNNGGDDDEISLSNDKEGIIDNMFAADYDELSFFVKENPTTRVGWVQLIYGNDGYDVICDYINSPLMVDILKDAEILTQKLEKEDAQHAG